MFTLNNFGKKHVSSSDVGMFKFGNSTNNSNNNSMLFINILCIVLVLLLIYKLIQYIKIKKYEKNIQNN